MHQLAEQGWGKGPGKLPSPSLWVPGEGDSGPPLNSPSAIRSCGRAPPRLGADLGGKGCRTTAASAGAQGQTRAGPTRPLRPPSPPAKSHHSRCEISDNLISHQEKRKTKAQTLNPRMHGDAETLFIHLRLRQGARAFPSRGDKDGKRKLSFQNSSGALRAKEELTAPSCSGQTLISPIFLPRPSVCLPKRAQQASVQVPPAIQPASGGAASLREGGFGDASFPDPQDSPDLRTAPRYPPRAGHEGQGPSSSPVSPPLHPQAKSASHMPARATFPNNGKQVGG